MKISRKLSVWTIVSLLVIGALSLYVHSRIMIAAETDEFTALANILGPIVEESLVHSMLTRDNKVLYSTMRNLEGVEPISRMMLVNTGGEVKAGVARETKEKRISLTAGQDRKHRGAGRAMSAVPDDVNSFRWVQSVRNRPECYRCHSPHTRYNGAIVIDFSTKELEQNVRAHIAKESVVFLSAFMGVGLIMFLLSNSVIIKRLDKVIENIGRFKDGDHAARISVPGDDEITRLAEGFNEMAESISGSRRELEKYAAELLSLAVSSDVVTAAPRTENIHEAVCNIAVKELGLKMAWVGVLKPRSSDIEPVAQCGFEEGYLSSVKITWDDAPSGRGPTGTAVRTKTPQVMNEVNTDPACAPWSDGALKRGYRSSMALPLLTSDGEALGVLNLYSAEPQYFTRKRTKIFMIFANQVATAIENRTLIENVEKTSRKLVEQFKVISRSQKEWRLTFDSITDLISIHDKEYNVRKANRAFSEYFGLEPKDIVNKKCCDLFHGMCSPLGKCPHTVSLAEHRSGTEEFVDPRTNKTFQVSTFPYYSSEGEFIGSVHIAKDVTEAREKEMRLIMSERLAALGQMASGLAHEINNPLASIAGCAEGLLSKVRNGRYDPGLFEEYLKIIEEEIHRCKSITSGMLSFVRKVAYEKKTLQINEAIDRTLDIIGFQGRLQNVEIIRNYDKGNPVIQGSEGELRQVFVVIVTNALDAMKDSGTLSVETTEDRRTVRIMITDRGPGISQDNIHRIFDPFFTTKSERGGTGLGLSIAHRIITNHGGSIDVVSEEGKGSTFIIALPKQ